MSNQLKIKIEAAVNTDNDFSMVQLVSEAWPIIETSSRLQKLIPGLRQIFGDKGYKKLSQAILRNAFLIELVKVPKIETTKFRQRWYQQLDDDPRGCPFEECFEIALDLLEHLPEWIKNPSHAEALKLSFDYSILPYEAPIDYCERLTDNGRIHSRGNLIWYYDELILRTLKLRKYLIGSEQSPDVSFFRQVLTDKIKVKTYLTDRVLTGDYKTNREKRWETHPLSVHFAERKTCMAIEYALVTELCCFKGFPESFRQRLQEEGILAQHLPMALCPITGDALSYEAFRSELLNPTHGKSDFQVGHRNPLKHEAINDQGSGHTAQNISWISADGNRIQGSLSLDDVRILIQRISDNYTVHGWWPEHRTGRA
ncbi:MAG: hypothetical protein LBU76_00175 [Azoarcus sp.]|jgi:hypothetical protein|nr:hypothetical protein [Azoarcus sp.]